MDKNKERIDLRKAQFLANLNSSMSGSKVEIQNEVISTAEFQERISKGEKFYTESNIQQFLSDVDKKVVGAYTNDQKMTLRKSAEDQLSLLKSVSVVTETGAKLNFYVQVASSKDGE